MELQRQDLIWPEASRRTWQSSGTFGRENIWLLPSEPWSLDNQSTWVEGASMVMKSSEFQSARSNRLPKNTHPQFTL
jgi:hypothetical protein